MKTCQHEAVCWSKYCCKHVTAVLVLLYLVHAQTHGHLNGTIERPRFWKNGRKKNGSGKIQMLFCVQANGVFACVFRMGYDIVASNWAKRYSGSDDASSFVIPACLGSTHVVFEAMVCGCGYIVVSGCLWVCVGARGGGRWKLAPRTIMPRDKRMPITPPTVRTQWTASLL